MKQLGQQMVFSPASADVRIAQYENDSRTPKPELIRKLADVLPILSDSCRLHRHVPHQIQSQIIWAGNAASLFHSVKTDRLAILQEQSACQNFVCENTVSRQSNRTTSTIHSRFSCYKYSCWSIWTANNWHVTHFTLSKSTLLSDWLST